MGLDVHHVSAVHQCLSHENRHSPTGIQCPGHLAPGNPVPRESWAPADMAMRNESTSAMGASPDDFTFVVEDVLEEYREAQPEFAEMEAPIDKGGGRILYQPEQPGAGDRA